MTDFLQHQSDLDDPAFVATLDELSFWASRFGHLLFQHIPLGPDRRILDLACASASRYSSWRMPAAPPASWSGRIPGWPPWHGPKKNAGSMGWRMWGWSGLMAPPSPSP